jgi:hypothetical protein
MTQRNMDYIVGERYHASRFSGKWTIWETGVKPVMIVNSRRQAEKAMSDYGHLQQDVMDGKVGHDEKKAKKIDKAVQEAVDYLYGLKDKHAHEVADRLAKAFV